MRFAVGAHWGHDLAYWQAHHGIPIMAYPPEWARRGSKEPDDWYNLPLFAPTWAMVHGVRGNGLPVAEYTARYRALMRERLPAIRDWIAQPEQEGIILLCACPETIRHAGAFAQGDTVLVTVAPKVSRAGIVQTEPPIPASLQDELVRVLLSGDTVATLHPRNKVKMRAFCHRHLAALVLTWLGCQQVEMRELLQEKDAA